jgi:hypothetical protein
MRQYINLIINILQFNLVRNREKTLHPKILGHDGSSCADNPKSIPHSKLTDAVIHPKAFFFFYQKLKPSQSSILIYYSNQQHTPLTINN